MNHVTTWRHIFTGELFVIAAQLSDGSILSTTGLRESQERFLTNYRPLRP